MRWLVRTKKASSGLLLMLLLQCMQPAYATSLRYCDQPPTLSATQKDKLLRMSDAVKAELERSGSTIALVSRSGLDLRRLGERYSHAGLSLRDHVEVPWAVRQLYYACDEHAPRLFDQGISGFLLGTEDPDLGYLSLVFLPEQEASTLAQRALDKSQALSLLAATYSANAYPFSVRYQNCNQWVLELLATALGALPASDSTAEARTNAQQWLQQHQYQPAAFRVGFLVKWASRFVRWVHSDDHPQGNMRQARYLVTLPAAIETFVHNRVPAATRVELCHNREHIVIHRGWDAIGENCSPAPQDTVIAFD